MEKNNEYSKEQLVHLNMFYSQTDQLYQVKPQLRLYKPEKSLPFVQCEVKADTHHYYMLYVNHQYIGFFIFNPKNTIIDVPEKYLHGGDYVVQIMTVRKDGRHYYVSPMSDNLKLDIPYAILGVSGEPSRSGILERIDDAQSLKVQVNHNVNAPSITFGPFTSDFDNYYPYSEMKEVVDEKGNVYIRIPKFYVKIEEDPKTHMITTRITGDHKRGYEVMPCFINQEHTSELPYIDVGKYLLTAYADSKAKEPYTFKAGSFSGVVPTTSQIIKGEDNYYHETNLTVQASRTYCDNTSIDDKNYVYSQMDLWVLSCLQILFKIEFATTNAKKLMRGYCRGETRGNGYNDGMGKNQTGSLRSNTNGEYAMSYRGIENLWGNLETLIDGVYFDADRNVYLNYFGRNVKSPFQIPLERGQVKTMWYSPKYPTLQMPKELIKDE